MSEYQASHMYARTTARKARLAVDLIRGLSVNKAIEVLALTPRRAARVVEKVLKSAVANATQDTNIDANKLYVSEARVDDGPLLGGRPRFRPASRGRAMPIRKRTSHIHVKVNEAPEPVLKEGVAAGAAESLAESET